MPLEKLLAAPVTVAFDDAGAEHFRGDPRLLKLDLGLSLAVVWPLGGDHGVEDPFEAVAGTGPAAALEDGFGGVGKANSNHDVFLQHDGSWFELSELLQKNPS